jgi:hypothetical protein
MFLLLKQKSEHQPKLHIDRKSYTESQIYYLCCEFLTEMVAWVHSQVSSCVIYSDQSDKGQVFCKYVVFLLPIFIPPIDHDRTVDHLMPN